MANATKDIPSIEKEGYAHNWGVAAATVLFRGTILGSVLVSTTRYARKWVAADVILGVSQDYVDNSLGANGDKRITAKRGCFCFAQNGTINDTHIDQFAKPIDDQTVALDGAATSTSTCGRIVLVTPEVVWVDFRKFNI